MMDVSVLTWIEPMIEPMIEAIGGHLQAALTSLSEQWEWGQADTQLLTAPYLWWSMLLGVTLSSAVGFRIFIPPLVLSVGSLFFGVSLPEGLSWLSSYPAMAILATATVAEVAAFYVPHVDNLLNTLASPAAVVAGTILTSGFLSGHLDPTLQWSLALIAGGGAAGAVQGLTATSRGVSTATTLGFANPVVTTLENIAATALSTIPFWVPMVVVVVGGLCLVFLLFTVFKVVGWLFNRNKKTTEPST